MVPRYTVVERFGVVRKNFHESYGGGEIKPPSERSTGLVFAVVAVIVAAWWHSTRSVALPALGIAVVLAALSLVVPRFLKPLNILWFRFGLLLHRIVNPLVMFIMFALVFVPAGYVMRIWRDPLRSRRAGPDSTYWIERKPSGQNAESMRNQF